MTADFSLDALLLALRDAGLRIGVGEVGRLHRVFELQPDFVNTRRQLKAVLRSVLVRSEKDDEILEHVCDSWLDQNTIRDEVRHDRPIVSSWPIVRTVTSSSQRWPWARWFFAVAAVILAVVTAVMLMRDPRAPEPSTATDPKPQVVTARTATAEQLDEIRQKSFPDVTTRRFTVPTKPVWDGWRFLILGLLAASTAGAIWWTFGQRTGLPEPAPLPTAKGPPRVLPSAPKRPPLLDARQRDALVWGIGHYLSDEPTPRLDLPTTVRQTARAAGLVQICFQLARHQREVWLWVDETADDPTLPLLADEVATTLASHGLPVERATFRGLPDELETADGTLFAPLEVDDRREGAAVAILTDGRVLCRQFDADDRAVFVNSVLRGLSHWPRLAFVDFSDGRTELRNVLERHRLSMVAPAALGKFLVSGSVPVVSADGPEYDPLWAATCCLSPAPVHEDAALELRRHLGLDVTPWNLGGLRRDARASPGRLLWSTPDRVRHLNWLAAIEASDQSGVVGRSVLGQALDFWEEIYDREIRQRSEGDTGWAEKPSAGHLLMERALLVLWRRPGEAAPELYRLFRGDLQKEIRRHLGILAPLGCGNDAQVSLPWSWDDLDRDPAARVMLLTMGVGGGMMSERLRRSGRVLLAVGLALGLALAAFLQAWREPLIFQEDGLEIPVPFSRAEIFLDDH